MARLIKDGSLRGQKSGEEFFSKASKILIIPAKELVQVIAQVCYFSSVFNMLQKLWLLLLLKICAALVYQVAVLLAIVLEHLIWIR